MIHSSVEINKNDDRNHTGKEVTKYFIKDSNKEVLCNILFSCDF